MLRLRVHLWRRYNAHGRLRGIWKARQDLERSHTFELSFFLFNSRQKSATAFKRKWIYRMNGSYIFVTRQVPFEHLQGVDETPRLS